MNKQKMLAIAKALDTFLYRIGKKKPPDWEKLHQIADNAEPQVRDAFLKAVAKLQGHIAIKQVEEMLAKGDIEGAIKALDWSVFDEKLGTIELSLASIAAKTGLIAVGSMPASISVKYSFDLVNELAVEWASKYVGELITQITEESRSAVRAIITDAMENGGHPYKTARMIRQHIGLTESDAKAVINYTRKLMQDFDLSEEQINSRVATYSKKKLRDRAENISRTETINAASSGQRNVWENAKSDGMLSGFERKWIITPDDRLCPECAKMKNKRAPIGGTYDNGVKGPTLHPRCRCAERLVEIGR